jgi:hypothetical protein
MFVDVAQKAHACSKPFRVTCGPTLPCARRLTTSATDRGEHRQAAGAFASDKDAHPAFVELIKEMTPADARVLKTANESPQCSFIVRLGKSDRFVTASSHYSFSIEGLSEDDVPRK